MAKSTRRRCIAIGLLATLIAGCTMQVSRTPPSDEAAMKAATADFNKQLEACTAQFGYDPNNTAGLGEHELGPGERAWRLCAYKGVNEILIPASNQPELYRQLIQEDRLLTDQVEAGVITRAQRKTEIEQGIAKIEADERQRAQSEEGATSEKALENKIQLMRQNLGGFGSL